MPGLHINAKDVTTALTILGTTAEAADGRFPAATANAAATLELALGLAFDLALAAGSCTNGHGSLLQVPLG